MSGTSEAREAACGVHLLQPNSRIHCLAFGWTLKFLPSRQLRDGHFQERCSVPHSACGDLTHELLQPLSPVFEVLKTG